MGVAGRKWLVAQPGGLTLLIVGLTARALPVIKREPTSVAIIARWLQVSHTAFSYSTYTDDTSLAIADDLLRCKFVSHDWVNNNSGSPPSCDYDFGNDRWRRLPSCSIGK